VIAVLDATALIATLNDEPAGAEVLDVIRHRAAAISAANLAEAIDILVGRHHVDEALLRSVLGPVLGESVTVVAIDESIAWAAAAIRARRHHRSRSPLTLGDCLLLATAASHDGRVRTSDRDVIAAARAEGLEVIPLPDSAGRRPS